jgi:hypothetical protein
MIALSSFLDALKLLLQWQHEIECALNMMDIMQGYRMLTEIKSEELKCG